MTDHADQTAFSRIDATRPQLSAIRRLRELPGLAGRILLHAGPPFADRGDIPVPVMNSLCMACAREGWVQDAAAARRLIVAGAVDLAPAQDHGVLVPLAGAVGPSSALLEVSDAGRPSARRYSPLNEGMTLCTRLGILHPGLPAHLRWLDSEVAGWIASRLSEPLALHGLLRGALAAGDDCHSRTMAGSAAIVAALRARSGVSDGDGRIGAFLDASPAFALNVWMAMCGLMAAAAEGVADSGIVTRAGGNGRSFGYQIAARPGEWIVSPAPAIRGRVEPAHAARQAVPALGDSALVDFMGLGGQALDAAPAVRAAMAGLLPADAARRPAAILQGHVQGFGRPGVTSAHKAARAGTGPMVLLGMIDAAGEAGRIGGGCAAIAGQTMALALEAA